MRLRRAAHERDRPLIVARVVNYPQIVSTLSAANERIADRADRQPAEGRIGSVARVYQGDEGIFAWTVPAGTAIGHHVEALPRPVPQPGQDRWQAVRHWQSASASKSAAAARSPTGCSSALVAADEATRRRACAGNIMTPRRLKDADWRLSLLSQLDEAIDHGQVWVAYQPQLDLRTNRIRGAEALARWTHPEKGPISPSEFIAAAEQHDRIEKLTFFVLDQAVAAAARINREHGRFDMAVNLSARMLGDKTLPSRVREILDRHGLDPARLTLELTETAALASGADIGPLFGLRDLGIRISIDDYGTGLSTLEYLKKIPASEIKIDQSFVKVDARPSQRPGHGPVDHRPGPFARPDGRRRRRRKPRNPRHAGRDEMRNCSRLYHRPPMQPQRSVEAADGRKKAARRLRPNLRITEYLRPIRGGLRRLFG